MESTSPVAEALSPESTVTTLLSSSGHLRSSLLPTEHKNIFRYRNKDYDSASATLDAYITDFDSSRQNSESLMGQLVLPQIPSFTPGKPNVSRLRNRDVIRERLTDRELDFLTLPVSSLCHRSNQERLSMTTDELLSIPHDGSMPVTRTSAFIQGLSRSGTSRHCCSPRPGGRVGDELSTPAMSHPHPTRKPRSFRCKRGQGAAILKPNVSFCVDREERAECAQLSSLLHPPRWSTSNEADMDCSGITSAHFQADNEQTLRDLRLQFAENISLFAAERKSSEMMESLFRDDRMEFLIMKADRVLNSLSQNSGGADSLPDAGETRTEQETLVSETDLLDVSPLNREELCEDWMSSHGPSFTLDSAVVTEGVTEGVTEAPTERRAQAQGCGFHGNSIWKQPGPLEALKQMMFRLQALEAEVQRQQQSSVAPTLTERLHTEETSVDQRPQSGAKLENSPGRPSLQRALHQLGCLKKLVEEPRGRQGKKEEKKDLDERLYPSSSADRLISNQQTPH